MAKFRQLLSDKRDPMTNWIGLFTDIIFLHDARRSNDNSKDVDNCILWGELPIHVHRP